MVVDTAKNSKVTDTDGREYIDFVAMYAVSNTGHANPRVMAAVLEQMLKAPVSNTSWINPYYVRLAEKMCKVCNRSAPNAKGLGIEVLMIVVIDFRIRFCHNDGHGFGSSRSGDENSPQMGVS